jgi:hypothetical protein
LSILCPKQREHGLLGALLAVPPRAERPIHLVIERGPGNLLFPGGDQDNGKVLGTPHQVIHRWNDFFESSGFSVGLVVDEAEHQPAGSRRRLFRPSLQRQLTSV